MAQDVQVLLQHPHRAILPRIGTLATSADLPGNMDASEKRSRQRRAEQLLLRLAQSHSTRGWHGQRFLDRAVSKLNFFSRLNFS